MSRKPSRRGIILVYAIIAFGVMLPVLAILSASAVSVARTHRMERGEALCRNIAMSVRHATLTGRWLDASEDVPKEIDVSPLTPPNCTSHVVLTIDRAEVATAQLIVELESGVRTFRQTFTWPLPSLNSESSQTGSPQSEH